MYKPESVEASVTKFEKTITDGRVLVNGKTYPEMDPDERAFFNLSISAHKTKAEIEEKKRPIQRWARNHASIYLNP